MLVFPTTNAAANNDTESDDSLPVLTSQVAHTLKMPETAALTHIIEEYRRVPGLSLLGEADMAREWIDDRHRNRANKRMTPAFFRRWLRREQQALLQQQAAPPVDGQLHHTTASASRPATSSAYRSLMHLETEYQQVPRRKEGTHE